MFPDLGTEKTPLIRFHFLLGNWAGVLVSRTAVAALWLFHLKTSQCYSSTSWYGGSDLIFDDEANHTIWHVHCHLNSHMINVQLCLRCLIGTKI